MSKAADTNQFDLEAFLDQTIFGMDTSAMLNDVLDFLNFSEQNIVEQRKHELLRTKIDCDATQFDDAHLEMQYRDQMMDGVAFRFDVLLTQRVRYAALVSMITTIDWVLTALARRLKLPLAKKPDRISSTVYLLRELCELAGASLSNVAVMERLVQVRNCVIHAAGLLDSYKYGLELCGSLRLGEGVKISNINFLGDAIEIEQGYLQAILGNLLQWLPRLEQALHEADAFKKYPPKSSAI